MSFGSSSTIDWDNSAANRDLYVYPTTTASFGAAIGAVHPIGSLTASATGITLVDIGKGGSTPAAGASGNVQLTSTSGAITFQGKNYRSAGSQQYSSPSGNNFAVNSGTGPLTVNFVASSNPITFTTGTISLASKNSISVSTTVGAITAKAGIIGNPSTVQTVNLSSGSAAVDVGPIGQSGQNDIDAVTLTGSSVVLEGSIYTDSQSTNTVTVNGPASLASTLVVDTSAGTGGIVFNSTIDGASAAVYGLSLRAGSGNVQVGGTIGGAKSLTSLSVNTGTAGSASASQVSLAGIGALASGVTGATDIAASASVTFTGTTYWTTGSQNWYAPSGTTFIVNYSGTVPSTASFTAGTGSTIAFNTGKTGLASKNSLSVSAPNSGAISMKAGIQGNGETLQTVSLSAGSSAGTVDVGPIGQSGQNDINAVSITGYSGVTLRGNVYTDGNTGNSVTVNGPATLNAGGNTDITIQTGAAPYSIPANNGISFSSSVDGAYNLNLYTGPDYSRGRVSVGGVIGAATKLNTLTVKANQVSLLGVGSTSQAGASSISVTGAANGGNMPTFTLGAANGTTYDVYRTSGAQTWNATAAGSIALGSYDVSLRSQNAQINLTGPIDQNGHGLTIDSTDGVGKTAAGAAVSVNGTDNDGGSLTVMAGTDGDVTLGGLLGGSAPLTALAVTGNDLSLAGWGSSSTAGVTSVSVTAQNAASGQDPGSIATSGATFHSSSTQTWAAPAADTITIGASGTTIVSDGATLAFTGKVDMGAFALTVDATDNGADAAGANITFNQSIDDGGALTITAGTGATTAAIATLGGDIGAVTPVASIQVQAQNVNLANVGTSSAAGTTSTMAITSNNSGAITLNGAIYSTTGRQTYTAVSVAAAAAGTAPVAVTLKTAGAANADLVFAAATAIKDNANGNHALTLDPGVNGKVSVGGDVGSPSGTDRPASLTIGGATATGTIALARVFTEGFQKYQTTGVLTLNGAVYQAVTGTSGAEYLSFEAPVSLGSGSAVSFQTPGGAGDDIHFFSAITDAVQVPHTVAIDPGMNGNVALGRGLRQLQRQ